METRELVITIPKGYEIDEQNSTFECIKFKKIHQINTWEDIPRVNGCYMNNSHIYTGYEGKPCEENKDIYLTDKYAKSALALAQISQLMPYYGGEITDEEWEKDNYIYTIEVSNGKIYESWCKTKHLIAFHTKKQLNKFLSFPENVQLIKDLYMID